jgi:hypothetical protein
LQPWCDRVIAVFWHFRVATNLLGDGQLIAQSFEAAEEGHNSVIMRSAHAIVTEETIAPGTTLLYYAAVKANLRATKKDEPVRALRALNCLLGGVFVFLVLAAARAKLLGAEARVWMVVLTAFSCSMLLFFGYIENYTTPASDGDLRGGGVRGAAPQGAVVAAHHSARRRGLRPRAQHSDDPVVCLSGGVDAGALQARDTDALLDAGLRRGDRRRHRGVLVVRRLEEVLRAVRVQR